MTAAGGEGLAQDRWRIHSVLLITVAMTLLGINILNVALPSLQQELAASESDLQWVLAGYALAFAVVLIPAGRAGDVLGRGGMYLLGTGIFLVASVAAGLANDITTLILARFAQGLGSGFINPQLMGIIQQNFRGPERGRAFGAYGSVVALAMGVAPLLGGVIIQLAGTASGWRWTFFVNVPISLAAILLAFAWFPRPLFTTRTLRQLDLDPVGVVLVGLSVLLVLVPFIFAARSGLVWLLLPASALVGFGWVVWERWYQRIGRQPIVEMAVFHDRGFRNGVMIGTAYFFGITGVWVLVALYLMQGLGFSAFQAGLVGLPSAACGVFAARWAGRRVARAGRKIVTGGIVIAIAGLLGSVLVVHLHAAESVNIWWLLLTLTPMGIGQGMVISPNQTLSFADVPLAYAGSTGGILQTGQRIGASTGIAVVTAVAFAALDAADWTAAFTAGFLMIAGSLAVALVLSVLDQRRRTTSDLGPATGVARTVRRGPSGSLRSPASPDR